MSDLGESAYDLIGFLLRGPNVRQDVGDNIGKRKESDEPREEPERGVDTSKGECVAGRDKENRRDGEVKDRIG